MKKVLMLLMLLALSISLAACGGSKQGSGSSSAGGEGGDSDAPAEDTKEEYDLKMSVTVGNTSTWFLAAEKLAADVLEASDGRIKIEVFPNEQLSGGNSGAGVEQVMNGTTDMSYHSTIIYSIMDERLGVVSAPFIFADFEDVDNALAGAGGEAIKEILRENGVETLGFGQNGFRQVTNSVKQVQTPEDLKGMKVRIPGISMYTDLWRELGADPTAMTFSEVFTALQQGTIDGQENPIDVIHSAQFAEVQKYITMWNYSYDPLILGINQELFDSMSAEDQEILRNAAAEANAYQIQLAREKEAEQIEELKAAGMEFYEPTEEELALFREAVAPVYEKYESIWGTDLLDSFR